MQYTRSQTHLIITSKACSQDGTWPGSALMVLVGDVGCVWHQAASQAQMHQGVCVFIVMAFNPSDWQLRARDFEKFALLLLSPHSLCSSFCSLLLCLSTWIFPLSLFCSFSLSTISAAVNAICKLVILASDVTFFYFTFNIALTVLQRTKAAGSLAQWLPEACSWIYNTLLYTHKKFCCLLTGSDFFYSGKTITCWVETHSGGGGGMAGWMGRWKEWKEGACFPCGSDSCEAKPYISFVPLLCLHMKIRQLLKMNSCSRPECFIPDHATPPSFLCAIPW